MIRSHEFFRASRQLHVLTSKFDWFSVLSVIGLIQSRITLVLVLRQVIENRFKVITSASFLIQSLE